MRWIPITTEVQRRLLKAFQRGALAADPSDSTVSAATLLERLERVTQCAPDRWRAICPAHKSRHRTQSLAVRELSDGTVLIHCHAGCGAADVVAAVGIELRDLFPPSLSAPHEPRHAQRARHWHAIREAVQTLHRDCLIVAIAAEDCASGRPLSAEDADVVTQCAVRIRAAIEACT